MLELSLLWTFILTMYCQLQWSTYCITEVQKNNTIWSSLLEGGQNKMKYHILTLKGIEEHSMPRN